MKEIEEFKRRRAERKVEREDGECGKKNLRVAKVEWNKDGGKGSGNFGHAGRIGEVGGSAPNGGGSAQKGNRFENMISSAIEEYNNKTPDEKIVANNELLDKYKKELEEAQKEFDYQKVQDLKFEIGQIEEENEKLAKGEEKEEEEPDVSNWKTKSRYEVGSTVAIAPEWLDRGESADFLYEVIEDNGDRSLIAPKEWTGALRPTQTVFNRMLVAPVGKTSKEADYGEAYWPTKKEQEEIDRRLKEQNEEYEREKAERLSKMTPRERYEKEKDDYLRRWRSNGERIPVPDDDYNEEIAEQSPFYGRKPKKLDKKLWDSLRGYKKTNYWRDLIEEEEKEVEAQWEKEHPFEEYTRKKGN